MGYEARPLLGRQVEKRTGQTLELTPGGYPCLGPAARGVGQLLTDPFQRWRRGSPGRREDHGLRHWE